MFWDPDALEKFKELQEARHSYKCNISCAKIQDLERKLEECRQEIKQKVNQPSLSPEVMINDIIYEQKVFQDLKDRYKDVIVVYKDYYLINGMQLVPINKIIRIEKVIGLEQPKCEISTDDPTVIYHLNIGFQDLVNILNFKN